MYAFYLYPYFLGHAPAEPFSTYTRTEHGGSWVVFLGVEVSLPCCGFNLAPDSQP